MKQDTHSLDELLQAPKTCYLIPRYQRQYSWNIDVAHGLLKDLIEIYNHSVDKHWVGIVLWQRLKDKEIDQLACPVGKTQNAHHCRNVIDGQQRITTFYLFFEALAQMAIKNGQDWPYEGEYALTEIHLQEANVPDLEKIKNLGVLYRELRDDPENDRKKREVHNAEREVWAAGVGKSASSIHKIFNYFTWLLWLGEEALERSEPLVESYFSLKLNKTESREDHWLRITNKLKLDFTPQRLTEISDLASCCFENFQITTLRVEDEDPIVIFEALNGQRVELSSFDHIRNFSYAFLKATSGGRADEIWENFWLKAEKSIVSAKEFTGDEASARNSFLYEFLISKNMYQKVKFSQSKTAKAFKKYLDDEVGGQRLVDWFRRDLQDAVDRFLFAFDGQGEFRQSGQIVEISVASRRAIRRIRAAASGPAHPLVMQILERAGLTKENPQSFTTEEVEKVLIALEGWMFRVHLNSESHTNLRAWVMKEAGSLYSSCINDDSSEQRGAELMYEEIRAQGPRWEGQGKIEENAVNSWRNVNPKKPEGLYTSMKPRPVLALLDVLEEILSNPSSTCFLEKREDGYEVDHIFPQKGGNKDWKIDLKRWKVNEIALQQSVHYLGNLSPIRASSNNALKDKRLSKKVEVVSEKEVALKLHDSWKDETVWGQKKIETRTQVLIDLLKTRWPTE
ncbi:MAG: DUF262 domain-containing protein [Acidimicrobiales bacterium]|nr:DUF262 domain-containing protein [Acidimicrobiales bacterium]